MSRNFDESLLTAYLDDELTPEERTLVEQHVAAHDEHRETLRQLGALKARLAAVPQESFSADPVAAVRRRIEAEQARVRLADGSSPASDAASHRSARHRPGWHLWLPLGLAASGLAMLTLAAFRQSGEVAVLERSVGNHDAADRIDPLDPPPPGQAPDPWHLTPQAAPEAAPQAAAMADGAAPAADDSDAPLGRSQAYFTEDMRANEGMQGAGGMQAAGGMGGARGAGSDGEMQSAAGMAFAPDAMRLQAKALPTLSGPASAPLPADARLYRLAQTDDGPRLRSLAESSPAEPSPAEPSPAGRFATAPRVFYQVPPGETEALLRWIGDAAGGGDDARPRFAQEAPGEHSAPVAVLIEAPPQQLARLLQSLEARIRRDRPEPAARLAEAEPRGLAREALGLPTEAADAAASAESKSSAAIDELVIVLVPTAPAANPPAESGRPPAADDGGR